MQNFKASLVGPDWLNCKASAPYSAVSRFKSQLIEVFLLNPLRQVSGQ